MSLKAFRPKRSSNLIKVSLLLTSACFIPVCQGAFAQNPPAVQTSVSELSPAASSQAAGKVVRWTGTLPEFTGKVIEVQFSIYENAVGGSALWTESQQVNVGKDGRYSVLLGAMSNEGLPQTLFPTGAGRWVSATPVNSSKSESESTRSLLAAVPYAFKAVDAEMLAGRSAADYVTREDLSSAASVSAVSSPDGLALQPNLAQPNLAGTGATNYLPIWTNSTTLGNSTVYETASKVGIGLTSPATTLDVNGTSTLRGTTYLPTLGNATSSTGYGSRAVQFGASSWSSANATAIAQAFQLQALPVGNNTASPSADLSLLYGIGSAVPKATGLSFGSTGLITFAAGQKFPGTGTITGITTTSPLSGGGTSGALTIGLNTTTLETTLNGKYAQLAAANAFSSTGNTLFAGPISATSSASNQFAVHGFTATGYGVQGYATGLGGIGTSGYSTANAGIGIYGLVTGGANGSNLPTAVLGHATNGYGVAGISTGDGSIGVYGHGSVISNTGNQYRNYGFGAGVWADSSLAYSASTTVGSVATVDDSYAQLSYNNSSSNDTLIVYNFSTAANSPVAEIAGSIGGCFFNNAGSFACDGTKSAMVPVDNNTRKVALYAVESAENWFEDYGSAKIVNGAAIVKIEPLFAQTVNVEMDYKVFLTPNGDCEGLYVSNKTPTGFEVHELRKGKSSVAFDYKIIARRKGYETLRLADKTALTSASRLPLQKRMEAQKAAQ